MTTQKNSLHVAVFGGHGVTALPFGNTEISQRRGLTLTEILAATFVLSFGLVAALSVLPFATHLLGRMDVADTSGACGRGVLQQIRMAEWQKPEALHNWNRDEVPADPYIVDPLGIHANPPPVSGTDFPYGLFAYSLAGIGTLDEANLHFRWNDDMVFAQDKNSERPTLTQRKRPDGTTEFVQQAAGDYTWMYMVTPKIDPLAPITRPLSSAPPDIAVTAPENVLGYEVAAIVFHRRDLMPNSVRKVNLNPANTTINAAGAYMELQSGDASAPGDPDALDLSSIKWILLTGPGMEIQPGNAVPLNAQWYRITGYDDIQGSGIYTRRVFLVGPDWKGQKDDNGNPLGVYAILCDGVVNVFQATMPK